MKNKKIPLIALAIVIGITCGIGIKLLFFATPYLYAGTIEATKVDVPARVQSVIGSLQVKEGDRVKESQTLMILSCEDYKIAADLAKETFDRTDRLYKQGSQAKEIYDQAKNRWDDANLKVIWCDVKAPMNGTVLNKYHEPGEMVGPGTRLFTLANLQKPYAYIYLPQPMIAKISIGQKLNGYLPELNMQPFEGIVTQINDQAEFTPKNVQTRDERTRLVFGVKIEFQNEKEILKPGMSIEVKLPEG